MMYILNYKGKKYNMNNYTQKTAAAFNMFLKESRVNDDFFERYKAALSASLIAIGKDAVKSILGDENELDVNDAFILVEEIAATYNKPLRDYKSANVENKIKDVIDKFNINNKKLEKGDD